MLLSLMQQRRNSWTFTLCSVVCCVLVATEKKQNKKLGYWRLWTRTVICSTYLLVAYMLLCFLVVAHAVVFFRSLCGGWFHLPCSWLCLCAVLFVVVLRPDHVVFLLAAAIGCVVCRSTSYGAAITWPVLYDMRWWERTKLMPVGWYSLHPPSCRIVVAVCGSLVTCS